MSKRTLSIAVAAALTIGVAIWFAARSASGSPAHGQEAGVPATSDAGTSAALDVSSAGEGSAEPISADAGDEPQAAEGFQWFWTLKGPVGAESGSDMAIDDEGNVFVVGHHGGLDVDSDGSVDIPAEGSDALLFKLSQQPDAEGVIMHWIRTASAPGFERGGRVAADGRGGAYMIGQFPERLVFDTGLVLTSRGRYDGYLIHYGPDGEILWARQFGGPGQDAMRAVATHRGNVYVLGHATGPFALDDEGTTFEAGDTPEIFIVSYDHEGAVRWVRKMGGEAIPTYMAIAPDGELWVSGELDSAVDLDGDGMDDLSAPPDRDGFYARYDENGRFLGAWTLGAGPGFLAFADNGDLFVLGALGAASEGRYGAADFDGDGGADVELRGVGPDGFWAARLTRDGRVLWVRGYDLERPGGMTSDGERIVIAGSYHGVRDLDEDGVPERVDRTVDPSSESELAILVVSGEDGRPERVWTAPGPGRDHAGPVAFLPGRPILYVSGYLQLTADFTGDGEDGEGWAKCESLGDLFFAQYRLGVSEREVVEPEPEREPKREPEPEREITLDVTTFEIRAGGWEVVLEWSGLGSEMLDLYRDGELIDTIPNDRRHVDRLSGNFEEVPPYRVCEAGTDICSPAEGPPRSP